MGQLRAELDELERNAVAREVAWQAELERNQAGAGGASRSASARAAAATAADRALAREGARVAERQQVLVVRRRAVLAATSVKRLQAEHAKWEAALAQARAAQKQPHAQAADGRLQARTRKVTPDNSPPRTGN